MTTWIGLVRALNVGGRNSATSAALRELFAACGIKDARTLLNSGNVVFRSPGRAGPALERVLEKASVKHLGLELDYMVRSAAQWKEIVAGVPLAAEAKRDPSHLILMCMKAAPAAKAVAALQTAIRGPEVVRARGSELYISYPTGVGTSKLTVALIERTLGTRGTGRNWNTVLKLAALTSE
jgi:uncharacterized protein (DUF1697 family)